MVDRAKILEKAREARRIKYELIRASKPPIVKSGRGRGRPKGALNMVNRINKDTNSDTNSDTSNEPIKEPVEPIKEPDEFVEPIKQKSNKTPRVARKIIIEYKYDDEDIEELEEVPQLPQEYQQQPSKLPQEYQEDPKLPQEVASNPFYPSVEPTYRPNKQKINPNFFFGTENENNFNFIKY